MLKINQSNRIAIPRQPFSTPYSFVWVSTSCIFSGESQNLVLIINFPIVMLFIRQKVVKTTTPLLHISLRMSVIGVWQQNGIWPFSLAPRHNYTVSNYLAGNIIDSFYFLTAIKFSCAHLAAKINTESWWNDQNSVTIKHRCIDSPFYLTKVRLVFPTSRLISDLWPLTLYSRVIRRFGVAFCLVLSR